MGVQVLRIEAGQGVRGGIPSFFFRGLHFVSLSPREARQYECQAHPRNCDLIGPWGEKETSGFL